MEGSDTPMERPMGRRQTLKYGIRFHSNPIPSTVAPLNITRSPVATVFNNHADILAKSKHAMKGRKAGQNVCRALRQLEATNACITREACLRRVREGKQK